MLAYNVDLLFLPAEAVGMETTQTRFYCQFVRKARLVVGSHDFYLLIMPLLLILLCVGTYYDWISHWKVFLSKWRHMPRHQTFVFGRTAIPYNEEKGTLLVSGYLRAQEAQAIRLIQARDPPSSRRRAIPSRRAATPPIHSPHAHTTPHSIPIPHTTQNPHAPTSPPLAPRALQATSRRRSMSNVDVGPPAPPAHLLGRGPVSEPLPPPPTAFEPAAAIPPTAAAASTKLLTLSLSALLGEGAPPADARRVCRLTIQPRNRNCLAAGDAAHGWQATRG